MNDPYDGGPAKIGDVRELPDRIVSRVARECRCDDMRSNSRHNQRVTIRLCSRNLCRGGHAPGATTVLDIDLLAEALRQYLCKHAAKQVGSSPCRKGND